MAKPFGSWGDRSEFLSIRSRGLGGSDIAAIIGESHWGTPLSVFESKVYGKPDDNDNEEAKHWGTLLEPVVRDEWNRRNAPRYAQTTNMTYCHNDYDYLLANSDGFVYPSQDATLQDSEGVYEGKTCTQFKAGEWADGVPDYYLPQPHWYMEIHGLPYAEVACLIGGQSYVQYRVEADPDFQADLVEAAIQFWHKFVLTETPPPPSGKAVDAKVLKRLHQAVHGETMEADPELASDIALLSRLKAEAKAFDVSELDQSVRARIGSAECVTFNGRVIATYKESKVSRLDAKALVAAYPKATAKFRVESTQRKLLTK